MRNSPNRIKFRKLAFKLQRVNEHNKIFILHQMIDLMESERDYQEAYEMHRTICANIINHNIVIGLNESGINKFRDTFAMAAEC